ncbi:Glutamine--tRNA ligase [Candidatus Westeberhardia cardiocondylae]|uniref:Glutamine--tRNA ligase n=1 Tax=Candidatus Westeberhardia cardiocondylae TaxID=1594731 RepID=A0A0H5BWV3_9ENTR|nr:glutamine--tRNA ligase [Candidatus Westeberhardia cardiocondylae]CEN32192.1 Glutamine--tRNA ligase [Candidatus Westeberhardia cardiocondylae]
MIKKRFKNFIYQIINNDLLSGKHKKICTRFPPEPNGYLHIGHAKSICLNFNLAKDYNGYCNLRIDDTNPTQENIKYINFIKRDIKWLGFHWNGKVRYSSDYFDVMYKYALELIEKKLAYVDQLSSKEIRKYRGSLILPGKNSPYRKQSIKKNKILFLKMKHGEFSEGNACLRAKINMNSTSMIMRDPILYRIKFVSHYRTKNKWCIYPTYDFAQCISDALEGITHSLCTLEFQENRKLYNWILQNISFNNTYPHQYEFSRLNLQYTVTSKRKIRKLIEKKIIEDWDDPRLPTISGLRRKGYTPNSIKNFCYNIGITRQDSNIEISSLESCIRKDLNENAIRSMAVINPLRIIIKNLPKEYEENIIMPNHPKKKVMGTRKVIFSKEIYIDKSDFCEINKKNYKRLVLGKEVRLRNSYIIKACYVNKDIKGNVISVICTYDPNTLHKNHKDGKKKLGVIHWVSAKKNIKAKFHLYEKLFNEVIPTEKSLISSINKNSLIIYKGFVESNMSKAKIGENYQFERIGYFCIDNKNNKNLFPYLIFNRTVTLREKINN